MAAVTLAPPLAPDAPAASVIAPRTLDIALALAAQGTPVFPLQIGGKRPVHGANWRNAATTDPDRIRQLWSCPVFGTPFDYNIGAPVPENEIVIDVDVSGDKQGDASLRLWETINDELPPTYEVRTASGGRHLRYRHSAIGEFPGKLATHIDIKQFGGYVLAPGSVIGGRHYEVVRDVPAAELPAAVLSLASGKPRPEPRVGRLKALVPLDLEENEKRAKEWLENDAPEAVEGSGGDLTTIAVANGVGDFGISQELCLELMADWNNNKASPPWDPDDLAVKVDNAYRYRRKALGIKAVAEFPDESRNIDQKPVPKRADLPFVDYENARPTLDRPYLVDDIIDAGAMVVTYGDSNVGKSYVVLDQAFHIAAGMDWNGRRVQEGLVVYIAAEGGGSFLKRIEALKSHFQIPRIPLTLVPHSIDLFSEKADTTRLIRGIRDAEARFGRKCVLVVVDTLARAMSGGDENTAVDMGRFVDHCDKIRAAIGCAINVIHHTGKDKSKGARGSSALRAATDTEIEVDVGVLAVNKQRDMAPVPALNFKLVPIEIGRRLDGKAVSACVVEWVKESEFERKITPRAQELYHVLKVALDAIPDKADNGLSWDDWETQAKVSLKTRNSSAPSRPYLLNLRRELFENGLIKEVSKNQWVA